jgi:hypothetical protein
MLYTQAVEPRTFSLLNELMALPAIQELSLVGDTALALRYGHRSSVDLDLFFHEKLNHPNVVGALEATFGSRFV